MEVGGWEACVVLLLSVSPSFSTTITWGFRLLTYLRGGGVFACEDGACFGGGAASGIA